MEKHKKNLIKRFFSSQVFLTLLGLSILTLISFPFAKNLSQRHKIDDEVAKMQEEIGRIEKKNSGLKELVNYLESDQFAEGEARLKMGLKKNGEQVAAIKDAVTDPAGRNLDPQTVFNMPGLNNAEPEKTPTNISRWFKYFFDN